MDIKFENERHKYLNKILYTRKQLFSFVKLYLIRKHHTDFDVRKLKKIMYGEMDPLQDVEREAVYLFNAYSDLLNNKNISAFCDELKIESNIVDIDDVISSVQNAYQKRVDIVYVFMIMNFLLVSNGLPIVNPYKKKYDDFVKALNDKDDEELYSLILNIQELNESLDVDYYERCLETTKDLIQQFVEENKQDILDKGKIKHLYLFGSYASGLTRYDSDIDMIVITNDDLTFEEKLNGIDYIKQLISNRFNRIVDIHETTKELLEIDDKRIDNKILLI